MTFQPSSLAPAESAGICGLRSGFMKAAWITPLIAVLVGLILVVAGHVPLAATAGKFVASLVYSVFIGIPSAVLLSWVAYLYTDRYPRLVVLLQAGILIFNASAGCLLAGVAFVALGMMPRAEYWIEFRSSYPFALVITLITGLGITSFETMRHKLQGATLELRTRQMEQERAYKLLAEARLSSLESRIHPHFLFNTLNSIAALIPIDPQRAEDTVGKLASLLRFSLNAQRTGLVPLGQELKVVRDYLEIEETRFADRLRYSIRAADGLDAVKVPPLAVQTLVENAVKHVVAHRAEGARIEIVAERVGAQARIAVIDDGPGFALDAITPEHGLGNLMERLELLFGPAGKLEVARENGHTAVRLSFPA